jgi:hypothetical protein
MLSLEAEATDDIGLRSGYFELIISSGTEEGSFKSTEKRVGEVTWIDVPRAPMQARINLATVGLTPGGLLSVRAVAQDGNTVNGPGVGTSETRTIRLAKGEEYDSVAIERAPPPTVDSADFPPDSARATRRLYLRGAPPRVVVNVDRVRLTGKEKPAPVPRPPGQRTDTTAASILVRVERQALLAATAPLAAADSLTVLRADLLASWPAAGPALLEAVDSLRAGRSPSSALARARRALAGAPMVIPTLSAWDTGDGAR